MEKLKIKQAIIVEGRYDKNAVSQIVDTIVIQTNGFSIFNDASKRDFIKKLADEKGIIILTDSDSAGMQIRNCIKSFVDDKRIINAFIPQIAGKERRKSVPSKEGFLGVEGVSSDILRETIINASTVADNQKELITYSDLYELGYIGKPDSRRKRKELLITLNLPLNINTNDLLKYINTNEEALRWLYKNQGKCTLKQS